MKLHEIAGAVNYWLDRHGNAVKVKNHAEMAFKLSGIQTSDTHGALNKAYWADQGKAYQFMYDQGAARLVKQGAQMLVDYQGRLSREQWKWLKNKAQDEYLQVLDDHGNVLISFAPEKVESQTDRVVSFLLD